jgi:hypothetical protein
MLCAYLEDVNLPISIIHGLIVNKYSFSRGAQELWNNIIHTIVQMPVLQKSF